MNGGMNHLQRHLRLTEDATPLLRLAFASTDRKTVDQHFGSCSGLLVYGVSPDTHELIQAAEFQVVDGHSADKVSTRIAIIQGCSALYCTAVGKAVYRELMQHGIKPVCVDDGMPIVDVIRSVQQDWPAQMAARQVHQNAEAMLDAWDQSGWDDE